MNFKINLKNLFDEYSEVEITPKKIYLSRKYHIDCSMVYISEYVKKETEKYSDLSLINLKKEIDEENDEVKISLTFSLEKHSEKIKF